MFRRSLPALAAALVAVLVGAGSFATAGDPRHGRGHDHGHGHAHGHGHKSCHHKRVSGLDERWLTVHIQTNIFEIKGGEAAKEAATNPDVRELAARLVVDHTAAYQEAVAVAEKVGVPIPDAPAPLQQWALRAVQEFSGSDFDRWFTDLQVEGHRQAIDEASFEARRGCNRLVRGLAAESLPVLEAHLEHAKAILESLD